MRPFHHYQLAVEIPATEVLVLVDALDGEDFSLRDRLGRDELRRQLEAHEIRVDAFSEEPWPDFRRDIATLSTYLSEPISGREIHAELGPPNRVLEGRLILGRRGETEELGLDLDWNAATNAPIDRGIDTSEARRRWKELPEWVRSSLSSRHAGIAPRPP